jgi:tRNA threonylcarbamoyladenosine biosynthesis protein TsaB
MRLLLIDTCGPEGVVALAENSSVVSEERLPGRTSSERLLPALRGLLETSGWRVRDLAAVVVVTGPGSFTGVRVGLSAAKGLCEAGGIGMIALSRLALIAAQGLTGGERVALLDAGRGEYYCGVYSKAVASVGLKLREELLRVDAVRALLETRPGLTCEARVAEALGEAVDLVAEPNPAMMLAQALPRIQAADWSDVADTDANYLRRTDAEVLVKGR